MSLNLCICLCRCWVTVLLYLLLDGVIGPGDRALHDEGTARKLVELVLTLLGRSGLNDQDWRTLRASSTGMAIPMSLYRATS